MRKWIFMAGLLSICSIFIGCGEGERVWYDGKYYNSIVGEDGETGYLVDPDTGLQFVLKDKLTIITDSDGHAVLYED